jgi:NAD(P)-dependent dehydrogenase (short-subunit alcohol dehydrogenase family)
VFKPFDLTGKVALVTGGNGGIGLGMADALAQAGAAVEIWGTNSEKNAKALEQLKAHGTRITARKVDVSAEPNIVAGFDAFLAEHGRADAVFANAGVSNFYRTTLDMKADDYRRVLAVNLDGMVWTMREAARHMKARADAGDRGGSIVAVSSIIANFGSQNTPDYAVSKAGIIGMTNSVAVEFARYGVRCNALLPGWVGTELTDVAQTNDKFTKNVIEGRVPMRRWGRTDEFGGIAVYLASDASSFHNGDSIIIDGGYTIY